jgi:ligand-binding sensor domain-containing protein
LPHCKLGPLKVFFSQAFKLIFFIKNQASNLISGCYFGIIIINKKSIKINNPIKSQRAMLNDEFIKKNNVQIRKTQKANKKKKK